MAEEPVDGNTSEYRPDTEARRTPAESSDREFWPEKNIQKLWKTRRTKEPVKQY